MKPTLEEIFGKSVSSQPATARPSLDSIFKGTVSSAPAPEQAPAEQPGFLKRAGTAIMKGGKAVFNALTSSEQAFGNDIAAAIGGNAFAGNVEKINQSMADSDLAYIKALKANRDSAIQRGEDPSRYDNILSNFKTSSGVSLTEMFPALEKTNGQVVGDAAGVLLDTLLAGTYGNAAKGAKTGELFKAAKPVVEAGTKKALGETLKTIGKETAQNAVKGAGVGYAYDVAGNLQQDGYQGGDTFTPGMGTVLGGGLPIVIGGIRAGTAIAKDQAPRLINSLIKPKEADFSYGKDPGRTVSEMGITGNNLEDFADNITKNKNQVGREIGAVYKNAANAGTRIDLTDEVKKLDDAIETAAKGGKNNQGIVTTLQNIKDSLLYEHGIDEAGNIVRTSKVDQGLQKTVQNHLDEIQQILDNTPDAKVSDVLSSIKNDIVMSLKRGGQNDIADEVSKLGVGDINGFKKSVDQIVKTPNAMNLSNLTPEEAFQFKKEIAARTQFTGRASDDKTVNAVLKNIYGGTKEKLNNAVSKNNPEIVDLNQKFADLTSAEIATRNRDKIVSRQNVISMPVKVGTVTGLTAALATGGTGVPVILAGIGAGALDKALASTAVKTRVAAWLGTQKPSAVAKIIQQNPAIKEVLFRVYPKLSSQIKLD